MISLEQIATLKRYVALLSDDDPQDRPVREVNPALAEFYAEVFHLTELPPSWLTEAMAVQALDLELLL